MAIYVLLNYDMIEDFLVAATEALLLRSSAMEANVTELWQIVQSMQVELDSMGTDMDSLWLMLGAILVACECSQETAIRVYFSCAFLLLLCACAGEKTLLCIHFRTLKPAPASVY